MIGIKWGGESPVSTKLINPNPIEQISRNVRMMYRTLKIISSPKSKVGVDQLSGPAGIARLKYQLLQTEDGWLRVLSFFVFFNVNLAILNMLPFPVLDGGHIVMALGEMARGKPPQGRLLESVQALFVILLMGFMVYVTTKDIGDMVPAEKKASDPNQKYAWPNTENNATIESSP